MHLHLHTVLDQLTMSLVRMSNALMESLLSSCQEVSPKRVKLRTYAAYGDKCILGANGCAEPDKADAADITAGSVGSARSDQDVYVWPSDRRVTHAEFAAGTVRYNPYCKSLHVHLMLLPACPQQNCPLSPLHPTP